MKLPLKNKNRTMNLLTKTCVKGIPNLYGQDGKGDDAIVYLKFFLHGFTWFLTELDLETGEAFGYVHNAQGDSELGYFSMTELANTHHICSVERDKFFKKRTLGEVKKQIEEKGMAY